MQGKANCRIADIDEMLQPVGPLFAALRYLALLYKGRQQDAMGILCMKQGRKRTEQDLERSYYKHMLIYLRHMAGASAMSQCVADYLRLSYIAVWIALSPVIPFGCLCIQLLVLHGFWMCRQLR